jgi:hypothetical protein
MHPFSTQLPVHSPHFIFIEDGQQYADQDLVERFGFVCEESFGRDRLLEADINLMDGTMRPTFVLAEADGWKMIADDWGYSLWHARSTQAVVKELAESNDLLTFSTGDSDEAYDLRRFRDGALVREWIVDDKFGGGNQRLLNDWGTPLPGERGMQGGLLIDYLLYIAKVNGFDLAVALEKARVWRCAYVSERPRVNETHRRTMSWRTEA